MRQRVARAARYAARSVLYRTYFGITHANYDRELVATSQSTPGGPIRTYELYNRHGRHRMLAELVSRCGPRDVVYDVGASVGVYALALATGSTARRVVAFEPAPGTADRLRANVAVNDLGGRVEVRDHGVGDEDGVRPFYVSSYPELSGFDRESATRWEATVDAVTSVRVRRLDEMVDALPAPDVVKIDVEGGAPAVLRGGRSMLTAHRPALFVEPHGTGFEGDRPGETRRLLEALEYDVHRREEYWYCAPR